MSTSLSKFSVPLRLVIVMLLPAECNIMSMKVIVYEPSAPSMRVKMRGRLVPLKRKMLSAHAGNTGIVEGQCRRKTGIKV